MLPSSFIDSLRAIVGAEHLLTDTASLIAYGTDALKRGAPADAVVLPADVHEVAA